MDELVKVCKEEYEAEQIALYIATFKTIELLVKANIKKKTYVPFINAVRQEIDKFTRKDLEITNKLMKRAYKMGEPSALMSQVDEGIMKKWNPEHYSERVWKNKHQLGEFLESSFISAMNSGDDIKPLVKQMQKEFGVSLANANTLLRTESTNYYIDATIDRYRSMGVEKYIFMAEIDTRTSAACKELNGQVFALRDAVKGVNMPPVHCNCRSTIVAITE